MISVVALWVGYAVLGIAALVAGFIVLSITGMLIGMVVTDHTRGRVVKRRPFRAPKSIWGVRHSHFLRTITRAHHTMAGEREYIKRIGYGSFLWADNFYRRGDDD